MKPLTTILSFLFLANLCFGQNEKEQKFRSAVAQIVTAFSKQDSAAVSRYIHQQTGVYQLDRDGLYDHYNRFQAIGFSDSTYPRVLFKDSKNVKLLPVEYASLPEWDCEKEAWSKKGLFVDTTQTDHFLSKIAIARNKYIPDHIPEKTIQSFYDLENKSRRIVLNDGKGKELVFYLSYLDGKWFLTIVDNVSSDCSV